jgi:phosphoglycolate phosphatase
MSYLARVIDERRANRLCGPVRFDLILFDLDGTLVDSLPDIASALNHALGRQGHAPLPDATVATLVGEGVTTLARRALLAHGVAAPAEALVAQVAEDVRTRYRAHPCIESVAYPEVPETLRGLRDAGARLAVLTNKPGDIARPLLEALDLLAFFDDVIGDGDGFPRKPDATGATALVARAGATAARTLMVGDGVPDVHVARALGCPAAAALWGYVERERLEAERPAFMLTSPTQVLGLVR